jgi:hypothetical protein
MRYPLRLCFGLVILLAIVSGVALAGSTPAKAQEEILFPYTKEWYDAEIKKLRTTSALGQAGAPPPSYLPPGPDLPKRYCTPEESQDFELNRLKPAEKALEDAFTAVKSYHRALGRLRDEARSRYESEKKHFDEFGGERHPDLAKVLLQELKWRWDDFVRLETDYTEVYKQVSEVYLKLRKTFTVAIKIETCQPPALIEIRYPDIAESFCTEAERQAAIDLLTPVVDAARDGLGRLNEWWIELTLRRDRSTDSALKAKLEPQIEEARQSAAAGQKVADELAALLWQVRTAELQCIDPCLIGRWAGKEITVAFDRTGLQIVDYKDAHPEGVEGVKWTGQGMNVITAKDGVARVKEERPGTVMYWIEQSPMPLGTLIGYGGLGVLAGDNAYQCTETQLTYQGSTRFDRQANLTITLAKVQ